MLCYERQDEYALSTFHNQAVVRLGVCFFMGSYFLWTGYVDHPLYLAFVAYTLILLWHTASVSRSHPTIVASALALDVAFTFLGLIITEDSGSFLFIFLIQIAFGYAIRFGRLYLWATTSFSCTGILCLHYFSEHWASRQHLLISYFFGVPFIALYIDFLTTRLREAKELAEQNASKRSDLLVFVSHDIRTKLQALLNIASSASSLSTDPSVRGRIRLLMQGIGSLARVTSQMIEAQGKDGVSNLDLDDETNFPLWMAEVLAIYTESMGTNGIHLHFRAEKQYPHAIRFDAICAERLLSNILSNAVRYAAHGSIKVILPDRPNGQVNKMLTVRIENSVVLRETIAPQIDSSFYGSGLGLLGCRRLAATARGTFSSNLLDEHRYVSEFSLPYTEMSGRHDLTTACESAILISSRPRLYAALKHALPSNFRLNRPTASPTPPRPGTASSEVALFIDATESLEFIQTELGALPIAQNRVAIGIGGVIHNLTVGHGSTPILIPKNPNVLECLVAANLVGLVGEFSDSNSNFSPAEIQPLLIDQTILIIDDNTANAKLLASKLTTLGASVRVANTVDACRQLCEEAMPSVIIFDWLLGAETGEDIIRQVKRFGDPGPILVLLSASDQRSVSESAYFGQVNLFVQRPVTIDEFISKLCIVLHDGMADSVPPPDKTADAETELLHFNPKVYEELLSQGVKADEVCGILRHLQNDACEVVRTLEGSHSTMPDSEWRKALHSLCGLCDSGGAEVLSSLVCRISSTEGSSDDTSAPESRRLLVDQLTEEWAIVESKIEQFASKISTGL